MQFVAYYKDSLFGGRLKQYFASPEADVTFHPIGRRILDRLFHEDVIHPSLQQTARIKRESY